MTKSYKYVSPAFIENVFAFSDRISLRCSQPKDFNDPYELFLTIDFTENPDALSFYADVVGELPQYFTTCFSKSPIVIPMWAHYALNHQGFVVEFDDGKLKEHLKNGFLSDVDYRDTADPSLNEQLRYAFGTAKMRHSYLLSRSVLSAAYFTKATCWSYEQERRLIIPNSETRQAGNLALLDVPNDCVTALIAGANATSVTTQTLFGIAEKIGCQYFEEQIGKSSAVPFLIDRDSQSYVFQDDKIVEALQTCEDCNEPMFSQAEKCSWCQIDEELKSQAAMRNPLRALDRLGMLTSYIKEMDAISSSSKKREN